MTTIPQLVGYDVRLSETTYVSHKWTMEKRNIYLLNPQVQWPLTVDQRVWPSYFWNPAWINDPAAYLKTRLVLEDSDEPRYQGLHLWAKLGQLMDTYLAQKRDPESAGVLVAVRLEYVPDQPHRDWDGLTPPVLPNKVAESWSCAGYDVADEFLMTALGYFMPPPDRLDELRETWVDKLNEHGLFATRDDAVAFVNIAEEMHRGCGPFCVYALYLIPV